jgi:hypothetical protein
LAERITPCHYHKEHDESQSSTSLHHAASRRRVDAFWPFGCWNHLATALSQPLPKASAIDRRLFHFLTLLTSIVRQTVEPWLQAEIRRRRDDAVEGARRSRLVGRAASERKGGVRVRIADGAQALSKALAALARSLRNGETG